MKDYRNKYKTRDYETHNNRRWERCYYRDLNKYVNG